MTMTREEVIELLNRTRLVSARRKLREDTLELVLAEDFGDPEPPEPEPDPPLDDFNRADEPLANSPNWTVLDGVVGVVSNEAKATELSNGWYAARWRGDSASDDHFCEVEVTHPGDGTGQRNVYAMVRSDNAQTRGEWSGYIFAYRWDTGEWRLRKKDATSFTTLATEAEAAPDLPYTIRLDATGTTIKGFVNDVEKLSIIDASFSGPSHRRVGFLGNDGPNATVDDFLAGPAFLAPSYNLLVSQQPDRSNPVALHQSEQSGEIYVFASPDSGVQSATFSLDGGVVHTERFAPFDFLGGTSAAANPFDVGDLEAGTHVIEATLLLSDETEQSVSATFTTVAATPAPPDPAPPAPARGPRAISKPQGAIDVNPGELVSRNNAASSGDKLWLKAGTHNLTSSFAPKSGVSYYGEFVNANTKAIMHGNNQAQFAFRNDGATNIHIENLEIRNFVPPLQQSAVMMAFGGGSRWSMEHCHVHRNLKGGVYTGRESSLKHSIIERNGQLGLNGSNNNGLIEDCEIFDNNKNTGQPGWFQENWFWEAGGSKFSRANGLVLRGNHAHDNHGPGLWADSHCRNISYFDNVMEDNNGPGIFHEVSFDAQVIGNTATGNGAKRTAWNNGAQIVMSACEPNNTPTIPVKENTVAGHGGILLIQANRLAHDGSGHQFFLRKVVVEDNDIDMPDGFSGYVASFNMPAVWESEGNIFKENRYTSIGSRQAFIRGGTNNIFTWAQWQGFGFDNGSTAS